MTALPPHIAEKCAKAIGQLSAANEGSVLAGARGLTRILEGAGLGIADLMEHVAKPREVVRLVERAPRPTPPSYPFGAWRSAACDPTATSAHRSQVDHLQNIGGNVLSRWEAEFLESLHDQLVRGRRLSERQVATLAKIDNKVRRRP